MYTKQTYNKIYTFLLDFSNLSHSEDNLSPKRHLEIIKENPFEGVVYSEHNLSPKRCLEIIT